MKFSIPSRWASAATKILVLLMLSCTASMAHAARFKLPVEVLGAEGTIRAQWVTLSQEQVEQADTIFFYANNLGYENKGSIRVNGGEWIDLNHTDIDIHEKEMHYGGMQHGGMNSIRFTIPSTELKAGDNSFEFRFNTSNGISIGYRIFKFNILDSKDNELLTEESFRHDEPDTWDAPAGYENNDFYIQRGKELWYTAELQSHYLDDGRVANWYGNELLAKQPIKATCSDCHTQDGRDLAYFAYSNKAILERSKFHGLTGHQGKQIAAYIRSLDVEPLGRPWNPPYQPGPSIADNPVEYWAAGAGIDAVLENDADMLPYMFPEGTKQWKVDAYFDSDKMHDTTIVPISVQFPDWKHWLPLIHPKDAFDGFYSIQQEDGSFIAGDADPKHNPFVHYPRLREFLEQNDHDALVENKEEFYAVMGDFWSSFRKFFTKEIGKGGGWRYGNAVPDNDYLIPMMNANGVPDASQAGFAQLTRTSVARLMAVKWFELHQEFQLEEMTQYLIPAEDQPASRQWLHSSGYNVFEVPPHFTANAWGANAHYQGQPWVTGVFETTAWYELQLILNPGNGRPGTVGPVDYNYHPGFIRKVSSQGRPEPMRYYRAMNNLYQVKTHSRDLEDYSDKKRGFYHIQMGFKNILPRYAPGYKDDQFGFTKELNKVKKGADLSTKVLNAMLTQLAAELEKPQNHPDTYKRSKSGGLEKLEWESTSEYNPDGGGFGMTSYRWFLNMKEANLNVSKDRLNRVIDWFALALPNMNWDEVRPE